MAWTTPASAAVVAPSRACNSTTVRALSARHKSRAKSLCGSCPEAWESGLCRSDPSDRAAGLSPFNAGRQHHISIIVLCLITWMLRRVNFHWSFGRQAGRAHSPSSTAACLATSSTIPALALAWRNTGFDQYLGGSAESQPPRRPGQPLGSPGNSVGSRSAQVRYVRRILLYVDTSNATAVRCREGLPLGPCAEPYLWA